MPPGRTHPRDKLATLLWAEKGDGQARTSLRQALADIRRALGAAAGLLRAAGDLLSLDPAAEVDTVAFERAVAEGTHASLEHAAALYRGDLLAGLLPGAPGFEDWLRVERERLRELALEGLARLVAHQTSAGAIEPAIRTTLQLLDVDPLQEVAHRALMRLYVRAGRREAALRQFATCVETLRQGLGVEPEAATRALHREVQRSRPAPVTDPLGPRLPPHHLPAPLLPLLGRDEELPALVELVRDPERRLVTLLGPPGVGKTRLALEAAHAAAEHFPDGAYWVDLAPVPDPAGVAPAIRRALRLADPPAGEEVAHWRARLQDQTVLLVLDNFEQVLAGASVVDDLLSAAPGLTVVVTSRVPLHVYGEHEFTLRPLALPDPERLPTAVDELTRCPSVALFLARARAVRPEFTLATHDMPAVATICARVDGLPLGIELAAARMKWLSVHELAARLPAGLHTPAAGVVNRPLRQRTLGGAIEWSFRLLDEAERAVLCRMSVFRGGFALDAGIQVAADQHLAPDVVAHVLDRLVEKSLLYGTGVTGPSPHRFGMLETIREFAGAELARRAEAPATRRRHAEHFADLAEAVVPRLAGTPARPWFEHLEREHANLGSALDWLLVPAEEPGDASAEAWRAEAALRLCVRLWRFWRYRCHLRQGHRWTTAALALDRDAGHPTPPALRAEAYWGLAMFSAMTGHGSEAHAQLSESLAIARRREDDWGVANALTGLGWLASNRGDTGRGVALQQQAIELFTRTGDEFKLTYAHNSIGESLRCAGDLAAAKRHFELSLEACRRTGHARGAAVALANVGGIDLASGRRPEATAAFRDALAEFVEIHDPVNIATCIVGIGSTLDDPIQSARCLGAADRLLQETGGRLQPADQAMYDALVATCRAALGHDGLACARTEGRLLAVDAAAVPRGGADDVMR